MSINIDFRHNRGDHRLPPVKMVGQDRMEQARLARMLKAGHTVAERAMLTRSRLIELSGIMLSCITCQTQSGLSIGGQA